MSEAMLSKEQIEMMRGFYRGNISQNDFDALCTLALSSIAMREALKPFADKAAQYNVTDASWHELATVPVYVRISDLRRAAEAYQEQGK